MTSVASETPAASRFVDDLTVLILTYNEEANIGRTLDRLRLFQRVVVLDSGSSDATCEIASQYPNVRVVMRTFDQHAAQWNHGLTSCGITTGWVLSLDADFVLGQSLVQEIFLLNPARETSGFRISFRYCIFGRALTAALYPPLVALFRRERTHYIQDGHTQRVVVDGPVLALSGRIDHDDRKSLSRWLTSQQKYASLEAACLLTKPPVSLRWSDRIRLMAWPAPILVFVYTLFVKRCLFDGWPGCLYVLQRVLAEIMIALEIIDRRLRSRESN